MENIAKTAAYQAGDVAKTAAYSAAYSAGPEDVENSEEEKLQVESDGSKNHIIIFNFNNKVLHCNKVLHVIRYPQH